MKKNLLSIFLSTLLLCSCTNNEVINTSYTEKLKTDLQTLSVGPWDSKVEDANYKISFSHSLTKNELAHVYTIDIGYKDTYIDDIHVIVLPDSFKSNPLEHNVPHIGYSQRINLAEEKNLQKNDRVNIRLQIEVEYDEEYIYVSVQYDDQIHLYAF